MYRLIRSRKPCVLPILIFLIIFYSGIESSGLDYQYIKQYEYKYLQTRLQRYGLYIDR